MLQAAFIPTEKETSLWILLHVGLMMRECGQGHPGPCQMFI